MIDIQAVRNKVLNLAMRGQLTEQMPGDGTAEELYTQIVTEKARLVKEGKIKKEKPLGEINGDDLPFDIPENWKWVYFGEIFSHNTGKALNASDREGKLLEYITTSNMYWDHFELENLKEMYFKDDEIEKCTIRKGDLLICEGGDIGRSAIWDFPYEMRIQNHIHKLRPYLKTVSPVFYYYVMRLYKAINMINGQGIGLQGFSSRRVHSLVVPLPPASEQERIVERIEAIFEILDKMDALQEQYASNQEVLKRKLIDAAIQGKLTNQLPEDGTAEELRVEAIKYKDELTAQGVLKNRKNKDIKEITEEDCLFELPSSWSWFRLGEIIEVFGRIGFRGYKKTDLVQKGEGAITMSPSNISKNGEVSFDSSTYISWEKYEESPEIMLEEGDVVLVKTGSTYGKCGIINEMPEKATINPQLAILKYIKCNRKYLYYVLRSSAAWTQFESFVVGAATPTFSQEKLSNMMIPIPPMAEQERIVNILDQIFEDR